MDMTTVSRSLVMNVFGNRAVASLAQRYGMRLGAARFIAGTTLPEAMQTVNRLNEQSIMATLDHLGESVTDLAEAMGTVQAYLELLEAIRGAGVNSNVSLKLTALGLAIDSETAYANVRRIAERARQHGNFVRIDMEDTPYTDQTLDIYRRLRGEGYDNTGVAIQSYLFRTDEDLQELAQLQANVRLVKGAYKEPAHLAYPLKKDVDAAFNRHIEMCLTSGTIYTAVATHDERAIEFTRKVEAERRIPRDRFEFQMLYGIRRDLQESLAQAGYRVRCYVPYGTHWYPYFVRRLAERPANLMFVLRSMFRR